MTTGELWKRYKDTLCVAPSIDLTLDVSRMAFDDAFLARVRGKVREMAHQFPLYASRL